MNRTLGPFLIALAGVLLLAANTFYIVPQTHQAVVLEFGAVKGVVNANLQKEANPGLYMKAPFIQNVVMLERRNLGYNLAEQDVVAADQERLKVDAHIRYRIRDPLRFYQQLQTQQAAEARLQAIAQGALRRVLGSAPQSEIISTRRAELMRAITAELNREVANFGMTIIDVRIRQADYPTETQDRVFERMRTERQQVAANLRTLGDAEATRIRAEADRQATVLRAEGTEQAEKIRGDGDARRAAVFSGAFGRDPEFAAFYRSMRAYETAIKPGTPLVIAQDGEFFRYLRDKDPAR